MTLVVAVGFVSCGPKDPVIHATEMAGGEAATSQAASQPWVTDTSSVDAVKTTDGLSVVTLENGLTVIVKENHTAPVVDVRCTVHTGSMYEGRWLGAGLSHLVEHLTAEGAEHQMPGGGGPKPVKVDRIAKIGGESNAFTTIDNTFYYITASAGKSAECIDLVSDWMTNADISKEDFEREHGVVQRELEMGMDNADRQFFYANAAAVFRDHPAGVPTIGYKAPLAALTYEDVKKYRAQTYVPQNMIFVVVGDVKTDDVLARVKKNFAKTPAGLVPSHTLPETPAITGVRRVLVPHKEVKEAVESISFPSITLFDRDLYALDLLSSILSDGQASRLNVELARKAKIVTSVNTSSWTPSWGRGVFEVEFRAEPARADAAEAAVFDQLRQVIAKGVTPEEVQRAKRQKLAELVYDQQTVSGQATTLTTDYMSTGNIRFSQDYTRRIQDVTPQQVQEMARKYFHFGDMVITRMVPADTMTTTSATTQAAAGAKAVLFTLPNGLRVVLQATKGAERGLVSMVLVNEGGVLLEDEKTNGLGMLMATLSTKGTDKYTADQIAAFFDQAGGSIAGNCGYNSFYWQATVLDDSFDKALDIFAGVVQHPAYPVGELEIVRPQMLAAIARVDTKWDSQMMKYFRKEFFTNSPYRMQAMGEADVIKAATIQQLVAYHRDNVRAGSAVLAVYGQFDPVKARAAIEKLFVDLPKGKVQIKSAPARTVPAGGELHVLPTKNEVASVVVAMPSIVITDIKDRMPLDVLDTIISGYDMPGGWLHNELRGKKLVYVVHAMDMPGVEPGAFFAYAAGQPDNQQEIADIIVKNLKKASGYTPTQAEIDEAVNTILTAQLLEKQSVSGLALEAALNELNGLGYDFQNKLEGLYRAVKPADVLRVGKEFLPGPYVVMVTTPQPKAIKMPTGQATTKPTTAPGEEEE